MANKHEELKTNIFRRAIKQVFVVDALIRLQFKVCIKQPMMIFAVFFMPLILMFGGGVLIPAHSIVVALFGLVGTMIAGLIFGNLYYNLAKTTFRENASLSNVGNRSKLFSISMTSFYLTFISMMLAFGILVLFESQNWFFTDNFVFFGPEHYESLSIDWARIPYLNFLYYIIINISLSLFLFQFVRLFFKSEKTFAMFILVYFLLEFFFGGALVMNYENTSTWESTNITLRCVEVMTRKDNSAWTFNRWLDWTRFFVPNYFANQQFSTIFKVGATQTQGIYGWDAAGNYFFNPNELPVAELPAVFQPVQEAIDLVDATGTALTDDTVLNLFRTMNKSINPNVSFWTPNGDWSFLASMILPYIYMFFFGIIGYSKSGQKK